MEQKTPIAQVMCDVYNTLSVGREHAATRAEIRIRTGYPDRAIRYAIELLRREKVILSLDNGYYIPRADAQGRAEARRWLARQEHRVKSIQAAMSGARRFTEGGGNDD